MDDQKRNKQSLIIELFLYFLSGFTLLSYWPKQLYSLINKSNTCAEGTFHNKGENIFQVIWGIEEGRDVAESRESKNRKVMLGSP